MKPKNNNKIILKQWVQVFLIILVLILASFSIWAICKSVNKDTGIREELYSYNYNTNLAYKVYLKKNNFYTTDYLDMNKQYISSLIDHIDVDTSYKLTSTEDINYTYTYQIIATARGSYADNDSGNGNADVWSKAYTILPNQTQSGTGKDITIAKTVSIDYQKYNEILTQFRNEFGLSVDARVDVAFKVNVTGGLPGEKQTLNEENQMTLKIPLLRSTITIKPDYVNNGHNTVYAEPKDTGDINIPLLIIGVVGLLLSLILLKNLCGKLLKTTRKSEYMLKLNKILKEYGDIIAEADNMPRLAQYDIVNIKEFYDLVDIEEELHSPIIYNEVYEESESWFMIFHDKTAYKYVLRADDFDRFRR